MPGDNNASVRETVGEPERGVHSHNSEFYSLARFRVIDKLRVVNSMTDCVSPFSFCVEFSRF